MFVVAYTIYHYFYNREYMYAQDKIMSQSFHSQISFVILCSVYYQSLWR